MKILPFLVDLTICKGVSESFLTQLKLYEQYAAASYCNQNFVAPKGDKLTCPTKNCPMVEKADAITIRSFTE
jgi:triacylglycerol lipase